MLALSIISFIVLFACVFTAIFTQNKKKEAILIFIMGLAIIGASRMPIENPDPNTEFITQIAFWLGIALAALGLLGRKIKKIFKR